MSIASQPLFRLRLSRFWSRVLRGRFGPARGPAPGDVDPETAPDWLLRDLGLRDGPPGPRRGRADWERGV